MNREETKQDELILIKNVGYFHPGLLGIKMGDTGESVVEDNNVPVKRPDTMISLEWVKTTDRLPTKEDAGIDDLIAFCYRDEWDCFNRLEKWDEISPQKHTYWHRMLKAPEVTE